MERTATDRKAAASGELTTDRKAGIARPVNRIAENIKEEGMVSEKSTSNALDYAAEAKTRRNRSVFRPQMQSWSCNTAQEQYNSSESVLKKEIPNV